MDKRTQSEIRYALRPNTCKECGKPIQMLNHQRPIDVRKKQFCGPKCNGIYHHRTKKSLSDKLCKCGKKKSKYAKTCMSCRKLPTYTGDFTLGYYINGKNYLSSKCQQIRRDARRTLERSDCKKECVYCKDPQWNKILQCCHIKDILEFSEDVLIKEINDPFNLVWLCPNHHAMFDKGLIEL